MRRLQSGAITLLATLRLVQNVFNSHAAPFFPVFRCEAGVEGLYDEALGLGRIGGDGEAGAQNAVHGLLHGFVGAVVFLFEEGGYVIVKGQSCAHILMLSFKTS